MKPAGVAAVLLAFALSNGARAECCELNDLFYRAKTLAQSVIQSAVSDSDVITPPDIDGRMALAPPRDGAMAIIEPPARLRQR